MFFLVKCLFSSLHFGRIQCSASGKCLKKRCPNSMITILVLLFPPTCVNLTHTYHGWQKSKTTAKKNSYFNTCVCHYGLVNITPIKFQFFSFYNSYLCYINRFVCYNLLMFYFLIRENRIISSGGQVVKRRVDSLSEVRIACWIEKICRWLSFKNAILNCPPHQMWFLSKNFCHILQ